MSFETLALFGTVLVAVAYIPQIIHLLTHHCAYGISIKAWTLWLTAGMLILPHAITSGDRIFIVLQVVNITAVALILVFSLFHQKRVCERHAII